MAFHKVLATPTITEETPKTASLSTAKISLSFAQVEANKKALKAQKIWAQSTVLISGDEYVARARAIAAEIKAKYPGQALILMQVLEGGGHMSRQLADAFQELGVMYQRASISTSSYGDSTVSAKEVKLNYDYKTALKDRIVIVGEDIVDTARTATKIMEFLQAEGVAAFEFVTGINKPIKRAKGYEHVKPSYAVLTTEDPGYCAGGGMDYLGFYRDKSSVHTADPELFAPTPPASPRYGQ